jgi:hypothetical protein
MGAGSSHLCNEKLLRSMKSRAALEKGNKRQDFWVVVPVLHIVALLCNILQLELCVLCKSNQNS